MVLVFDIGGSSTKIAIINRQREIVKRDAINYPDLIASAELLPLIKQKVVFYCQQFSFSAISIATCGVVLANGAITGLSAITDYHKINWKQDLKEFKVPIYVENDANCSLLAECKYGSAQGYSNVIALVLGTGIGGAIMVNNQVLKGLSGEFGCFLEKIENNQYINLSLAASPRNLELKLNSLFQEKKVFKDYLAVNYQNNQVVKDLVDDMIFVLAKNIVNLSFTINPEIFIIGGAISANNWFIEKINDQVDQLLKMINFNRDWQIVSAVFKNDANILGAYSLFERAKNI